MKDTPNSRDVGQALTEGPHESSLQVLDLDFLTYKKRGFDQALSESPLYSGNP